MARGVYIGIGGVARKVKRQYIGISGTARRIRRAYIGVNSVARKCFGEDWYFEESYSNPNPSGTNTHNVEYTEGNVIATQNAAISFETSTSTEQTRLFLRLRGLNAGDTVEFDWEYIEGNYSSYNAGMTISNYNWDFYENRNSTSSGSESITITADDGGGIIFQLFNGSTTRITQTLTLSNFKINGETVDW